MRTFASIQRAFTKMGATVEVVPPRPWISKAVDINIEDRKGREVFTLCCDRNVDPQVLNVAAADRHLLLYANGERFLCGHDERHWFVAAVSERVSTVREAKTALLPPGLREEALRLTGGRGLTRKNDLFHRQGEWFFRRVTDWDEIVALNRLPVHKNEAVRRARTRGRAKPHFCEEVVRRGGISVAILSGGVEMTEREFASACQTDPTLYSRLRERRIKDPEMYARGWVKHPDHATIVLPGWHRVFLNGEVVSGSVSFYD